ncbi:hypothetical protein COO91_00271 [Nostoc flagelliforme CCNUN1]|uniref:Uncharacterized protein n=1 Tax=Nostoc flagelliforme CCNUN1 TaxID=2038116 RepID=A0A2K8SG67_9NOSO|nr:hypothetical protein COO91_00271 [Nostoc flagelliforme CCNUN1]
MSLCTRENINKLALLDQVNTIMSLLPIKNQEGLINQRLPSVPAQI